ncbi:SDR family NAD(P)-dependent oxidoreductase [Aquabacterium sp. OR-4]|uniref:SDR family NAD(P)-dependent oxidoreductase n=1 Tax=Aquabacterium sp. OR-4 TaxID=2978127 RepID=UPI0021B41BF5|nr:SDR family oxidoreductase [Aquabacterium sp. OR-4]MDT7836509.1 SDR family oxidoreductase [Aquabacterium sp. OR-4]
MSSTPATAHASAAAPPAAAYARHPSLQGRCVFISGGATGIGECLVEQFMAQGARVGFCDIALDAGQALVQRLAGQAAQRGGAGLNGPLTTPLFVPCDITDVTALRAAIAQVREAFGPVLALLNNAANDRRHTIDEVTPEFWDSAVAVNMRHAFFAAQAVAPDMRAAHAGSIINFGSVSWMLRQGDLAAYASSKAAMQGLTRTLARDLGTHGIRVNTLVPGWTMTDKQRRLWVTAETEHEIRRNQCIGEPVLPEHIAHMALFLAADDSRMCTAQTFVVDGGWV